METYEDMETLYTDCLDKEIGSLEYQQFYITTSYLYIISDRCSDHYNMALDELWDFEFSFRLEALQKYFTNYGTRFSKE